MPGVLPVLNRRAFDLSLRTAVALNCEIANFTKWDRKNYYYPDLPKGYQISQYDLPFSRAGWLDIRDSKGRFEPNKVGIIRVHLEEDAGKSMHDETAGEADSLIDLNRAGTPLLEIVTEPDIRSPEEAKAFLTELKLLLTYLDVSDCNMQEGSLRVDANINLHVPSQSGDGKIATPIVEVKNMNSFRAVERALSFEATRQFAIWQETGQKLGDVPKQTRGWDVSSQTTKGQRHKEESSDYRYFPEPDLVPVTVTKEEVAAIRDGLGELPAGLRDRLEREFGISQYDSEVLVSQGRSLVAYFAAVAESIGDGKLASNWVQQDVLRMLKERSITIEQFPIPVGELAALLKRVAARELNTSKAREAFMEMLDTGKSAEEAIEAMGIEVVEASDVEQLCRELIGSNPKTVEDFRAGKKQAIGALIGQAKKRNPNVDPAQVKEICVRLIETAQ